MIGKTLGHYDLLEKIGAGGMGEVYRAHDRHLERDVALKILPPGFLADEITRKRFRGEALALSKLNTPTLPPSSISTPTTAWIFWRWSWSAARHSAIESKPARCASVTSCDWVASSPRDWRQRTPRG